MSACNLRPRIATQQDFDAVVAILVSAFHDDPAWSWAFPDPSLRAELALLADNLRQIDEAHVPSYLESSNPANVPLYRRYGFVVRGLLCEWTGQHLPLVSPGNLAAQRRYFGSASSLRTSPQRSRRSSPAATVRTSGRCRHQLGWVSYRRGESIHSASRSPLDATLRSDVPSKARAPARERPSSRTSGASGNADRASLRVLSTAGMAEIQEDMSAPIRDVVVLSRPRCTRWGPAVQHLKHSDSPLRGVNQPAPIRMPQTRVARCRAERPGGTPADEAGPAPNHLGTQRDT